MKPLVMLAFFIFFPLSAHAAEATGPSVQILDDTGVTYSSFVPFPDGTIGGVAAGDLGKDGVPEIIVAAGPGSAPLVSIFRQDGSPLGSFLAYADGMTAGLRVAVCDLDGNGMNEIITGTHVGAGPHVRIFNHLGALISAGFFAYDAADRNGVVVACADINDDGRPEILTVPGVSDDAQPLAFTNQGELVTPPSPLDATLMQQPARLDGGRTLAFDAVTNLAYVQYPQYIEVDLSEQRLRAYQYGVLVNSFLISSGTRYFPTPLGQTTVTDKLEWHDYGGPGYWLPDVQYNLRFRRGYYIHYAYWHNNFGTPMSHGCINTGYEDAKWVYTWANVGTPVGIVP